MSCACACVCVCARRHLPAVPQSNVANLEAWLSTWRPPSSEDSSEVHNPMRVGIVKLRPDVWDMPLRSDLIHRIVLWQRSYGCARRAGGTAGATESSREGRSGAEAGAVGVKVG
eukprot:2621229-Pleurochrysis_carterae.AAC.1